jgi:ABC-2 type transport system ATP-binding protein
VESSYSAPIPEVPILIEVENLTKYYDLTVGVKNLNFHVDRGEVLGFLGPNGAGKTTTMKMLTCYLPPTSGTARVCGFDILEQPIEVRSRIGYLPEKNPLYPDMRVREYIEFVASLKGVPKHLRASDIDRALDLCGLGSVRHRTIGKLSKGFQQRVGLAQAILHDPELLILDEPTLGLDPKQIIEIRQLIKNIGEDRTVILSSHILPEVSQVCNRIIIINEGVLVAVDTPDNLRARLKKSSVIHVKLAESERNASAASTLSEIDGVTIVRDEETSEGLRSFVLESRPDADLRPEIARRLVEGGYPLLEIFSEELSLEDIFLQLVTEEAR